ncbi:collagen-like protein [Meridianimarinicoccus sp. RP-17]|uniref:collagen-like protein n=1 Tax=Meridianimarinicoccus zhengii TaxID=2056810 RepID=UPI000DAB6C53|nr:collagen-like protein [Phycocomes zhengii]
MLDEPLKSCLPCGLHAPVRNYYFDGKLLVSRDFTDEQDYHRGLRHLHNLALHGTGTVCGLKVIQHPIEACRRENVVIEPGLALDCCGQELIVPDRLRVAVAELLESDPDLAEALDGSRHLVVGLRRCDRGAEPLPVLLPGCGAADATEYGRVVEGVEVVLWAVDPAGAEARSIPVDPRLDWVHTMTFGAQTPQALHVNQVLQRLQVAVDNQAGGSHGYVFISDTDALAQTHDLRALLEGPAGISDTASSAIADLMFFAGRGWSLGEAALDGVGIWRAGSVESNAEPLAVIPTEARLSRLAVSPVSGTLFVLEFDGGGSARLVSYSNDALRDWVESGPVPGDAPTAQAVMTFDHGFGNATGPARRGAAMMKVSPDGRFLALSGSVGAAGERLYVIDIAAFSVGTMTQAEARPAGYTTPATERLMALDWSLDSSHLFLLSQRPAAGGTIFLNRYALTGDGNALERSGQGVSVEGAALDLAVAPTESRAYVLMTDAEGATRLTLVDMDDVISRANTDPLPVTLSPDALTVDGAGRSLALMENGRRLYLSAADADEAAPDRGLVAVINVTETDCGAHFWEPLDACPSCARDEDHAVILAHLPHYVATDAPRMMDADQARDEDVAIDNRTFRRMVPSAATLKDVVECILAQGVAEGPPGPRGNPGTDGTDGTDGADGLSINAATVTLDPPGSAPSVAVEETADGLTLRLTLPAPADGTNGTDGAGIDDATIRYVEGLADPQVAIVPQGDRRVLAIDLPAPATGGGLPEVNPIEAVSWVHGRPYPLAAAESFLGELRERGIAVGFRNRVDWTVFTGTDRAGETMLAELQHRVPVGPGSFVWATLGQIIAEAIDFDDGQVSDGLLEDWTPLASATEARGFRLFLGDGSDTDLRLQPGETLRLVFRADFVVDTEGRVVDGSFLNGRLPTGQGAPGDTFRSWFTIPGRDG